MWKGAFYHLVKIHLLCLFPSSKSIVTTLWNSKIRAQYIQLELSFWSGIVPVINCEHFRCHPNKVWKLSPRSEPPESKTVKKEIILILLREVSYKDENVVYSLLYFVSFIYLVVYVLDALLISTFALDIPWPLHHSFAVFIVKYLISSRN